MNVFRLAWNSVERLFSIVHSENRKGIFFLTNNFIKEQWMRKLITFCITFYFLCSFNLTPSPPPLSDFFLEIVINLMPLRHFPKQTIFFNFMLIFHQPTIMWWEKKESNDGSSSWHFNLFMRSVFFWWKMSLERTLMAC